MSEYRIKAKSAEHRKAIIGALKALGFPPRRYAQQILNGEDFEAPMGVFCNLGDNECGTTEHLPTHTSLDSLIEDIIGDLHTVTVDLGATKATVWGGGVQISDGCLGILLTLPDFDRIAEAVAKVRKP